MSARLGQEGVSFTRVSESDTFLRGRVGVCFMKSLGEYIRETNLAGVSQSEFVAKYQGCSPLLVSLRGSASNDTGPIRTMVLSPKPKRQENPLERMVYSVEKRLASNSFAMWVTLGRALNNDVVVTNSAVSKFHATIERLGGKYVFRDRGSMNGSAFLKDSGRVSLVAQTPVALEDKCQIELGGSDGELLLYLADAGSVYDSLSIMIRD